MDINIKHVNNGYIGPYSRSNAKKSDASGSPAESQRIKSDVISISAKGNFRSELDKAVKSAAENIESMSGNERISSIKEKIDAGTYIISTGDIVDSIFDRIG